MQRVNLHLSDEELEWLRDFAKFTGVSVAEHVRRAVDAYRRDQSKEQFPGPEYFKEQYERALKRQREIDPEHHKKQYQRRQGRKPEKKSEGEE